MLGFLWEIGMNVLAHQNIWQYQDIGLKYGAVPITITHDVLEYKIEKIITDKETAMETAVEMYGYCPDVDQSYETLGQLAGSLINSSVWYFWWD